MNKDRFRLIVQGLLITGAALICCTFSSCTEDEKPFYERTQVEALADLSKLYKYEVPKSVGIKSTMAIKDTAAAIELGDLLFHMPTDVSKTACEDCHSVEASYYGLTPLRAGGSKYRGKYIKSLINHGADPVAVKGIPIDEKSVKSRTSLGLAFNGDRVLSAGFKAPIPGEFQVSKASSAHFLPDLTLVAAHDIHLNELAVAAYDTTIIFEVVACALSAFQQNLLPYNNNISKFLRGESNVIYGDWELYDEKCNSCHTSNSMHTSLSIQMDSVLVPRLLNVADSPCFGTDCIETTMYRFIKAHWDGSIKEGVALTDTLTQDEIYRVRRFITKDLHDYDLLRYDNMTYDR